MRLLLNSKWVWYFDDFDVASRGKQSDDNWLEMGSTKQQLIMKYVS